MLTTVNSESSILRGLTCHYCKTQTNKTRASVQLGLWKQRQWQARHPSQPAQEAQAFSSLPSTSYFYCIVVPMETRGTLGSQSSAQVLLTPEITSECEWNKSIVRTHICPPDTNIEWPRVPTCACSDTPPARSVLGSRPGCTCSSLPLWVCLHMLGGYMCPHSPGLLLLIPGTFKAGNTYQA